MNNHLTALINMLSHFEIERELAMDLLELYVVDFIDLEKIDGEIPDEDFEVIQNVAHAFNLTPNDLDEIFAEGETTVSEEPNEEEVEYAMDDNFTLSKYINKWIDPEKHDSRYLF